MEVKNNNVTVSNDCEFTDRQLGKGVKFERIRRITG